MTTRSLLLPLNGQREVRETCSRMLIIAPLADIFSGVGNFGSPPQGPWRLAFWLRRHGHTCDVWDSNVSKSLCLPAPEDHVGRDRAEALAEAFVKSVETDYDVPSYEWIGFSILNDTLPTTLAVIELVRKKYPTKKLIGGNHEATVNLQDCIGKSQLNAVILGDAEDPMRRLLDGEEPSRVPGVLWRNFNPKPPREHFEAYNDEIRWSEIPFEVYWNRTASLYPLAEMSEEDRLTKLYEIKTVRVHSILACELACTYCSVSQSRRVASGSTKPSIVNLSPSALERTLLAVKKQVPGVMSIYDSSDEAWLGRGRADEYLDVLERIKPVMDEGLPRGLRFLLQVRTNDLTESIVSRAGRLGVRHLTIGVESPIAAVRKDLKKPQSEDLIRNAIRWGAENNCQLYLLFIMFAPSITLEQLYEAVENWRVYISLGAVISVEPFMMSYLSTALNEDPRYLTEYAGYTIPFSGGKRLKWATLIWPEDRRVCAILQWFRDHVDDFIAKRLKQLGHRHGFKGASGTATVDCLEEALRLWDLGQIPPWEPGVGRRSAVYQDYGDQMSGSEIAAAASQMLRPNKTASRFNSTHSLLDDVNAGVRGRIKDPALPHEMLPKPPGEDAE